ncbi:type II secretion system (T2SS) protein J [Pseudomonas sp. SJZ103]|uniref:type II secretion system protein GspJ n=1 Tax=unclassified Pseudomonas TaxID=196821 RepID=UPI0011A4E7AA|nr:type II secretion system (T2SS) protein J [Pseudomonas sp. SJZ103]TWC84943.1 type II secretion system (T2SS) protein J [Pseudomonas sp. SJZ094]
MNVRKPNAGKLLKKLPLAEGCAHPVLPRYPVFRLGREALHQRRCHAGCTGRLVGLDVKSRPAALPENGLQRVRWWLEGDTLYRATSAASDRYPLPAPQKAVAVLSGISELQVRIWEAGQGWRQLAGNCKADPVGLEISLTRQTPQGEERYRQVLGPLQQASQRRSRYPHALERAKH